MSSAEPSRRRGRPSDRRSSAGRRPPACCAPSCGCCSAGAATRSLLVVLALVPVLVGVAIRVSTGEAEPGEGPPFLDRVSGNGLFLVVHRPRDGRPVLPPAHGRRRLRRRRGRRGADRHPALPADRPGLARPRCSLVKYGGLRRLRPGRVAARGGRRPGRRLGAVPDRRRDAAVRHDDLRRWRRSAGLLLVALYVAVSLAGLAALGLAVSTFTEVPVAAMATTVVLAITSQILGRHPAAVVAAPVPVHPPVAGLRRPAARPRADRRDRRRAGPAGGLDRGGADDRLVAVHDQGHHELSAAILSAAACSVSSRFGNEDRIWPRPCAGPGSNEVPGTVAIPGSRRCRRSARARRGSGTAR